MVEQTNQKAIFRIYKNKEGKQEDIPVLFNPAQYVIRKSVQYENSSDMSAKENKKSNKRKNYKGSKDQTLSVELFFDTSEKTTISQKQLVTEEATDVSIYTNKILEMTEVQPDASTEEGKTKPPLVGFIWGSTTFIGHVESVDITYTMFTGNGMPVRAKVNISIGKDSAQEYASASGPIIQEQVKTISRNISNYIELLKLSRETGYSFSSICSENNIRDPLNVEPGQLVTIELE